MLQPEPHLRITIPEAMLHPLLIVSPLALNLNSNTTIPSGLVGNISNNGNAMAINSARSIRSPVLSTISSHRSENANSSKDTSLNSQSTSSNNSNPICSTPSSDDSTCQGLISQMMMTNTNMSNTNVNAKSSPTKAMITNTDDETRLQQQQQQQQTCSLITPQPITTYTTNIHHGIPGLMTMTQTHTNLVIVSNGLGEQRCYDDDTEYMNLEEDDDEDYLEESDQFQLEQYDNNDPANELDKHQQPPQRHKQPKHHQQLLSQESQINNNLNNNSTNLTNNSIHRMMMVDSGTENDEEKRDRERKQDKGKYTTIHSNENILNQNNILNQRDHANILNFQMQHRLTQPSGQTPPLGIHHIGTDRDRDMFDFSYNNNHTTSQSLFHHNTNTTHTSTTTNNSSNNDDERMMNMLRSSTNTNMSTTSNATTTNTSSSSIMNNTNTRRATVTLPVPINPNSIIVDPALISYTEDRIQDYTHNTTATNSNNDTDNMISASNSYPLLSRSAPSYYQFSPPPAPGTLIYNTPEFDDLIVMDNSFHSTNSDSDQRQYTLSNNEHSECIIVDNNNVTFECHNNTSTTTAINSNNYNSNSNNNNTPSVSKHLFKSQTINDNNNTTTTLKPTTSSTNTNTSTYNNNNNTNTSNNNTTPISDMLFSPSSLISTSTSVAPDCPPSFNDLVKRSTRFITAVPAYDVLDKVESVLQQFLLQKLDTPIGIIGKIEVNRKIYRLEVWASTDTLGPPVCALQLYQLPMTTASSIIMSSTTASPSVGFLNAYMTTPSYIPRTPTSTSFYYPATGVTGSQLTGQFTGQTAGNFSSNTSHRERSGSMSSYSYISYNDFESPARTNSSGYNHTNTNMNTNTTQYTQSQPELFLAEFIRGQIEIFAFKRFYQLIRHKLSELVKKDYKFQLFEQAGSPV